jgi:uncharacterized protein YbjQ (UPF0145 family)
MNWSMIFFVYWPLFLLVAAFAAGWFGVWLDSEHRRGLEYRRGMVGHVLVSDVDGYPGLDQAAATPRLLHGEVVLAANRINAFRGRIKQLFGGEVRSYHDLITRARQEAMLRLMESAARAGLDAVGNVRIEAVDVAGVTVDATRAAGRGIYVGVMAYGMGYKRIPGVYPPPAPPTLSAYPQ